MNTAFCFVRRKTMTVMLYIGEMCVCVCVFTQFYYRYFFFLPSKSIFTIIQFFIVFFINTKSIVISREQTKTTYTKDSNENRRKEAKIGGPLISHIKTQLYNFLAIWFGRCCLKNCIFYLNVWFAFACLMIDWKM